MKTIWYYKELGYTRNKAIEKLYRLKFKDDKYRGWYIDLPKRNKANGSRIHIIPSSDYFTMHIDNKQHKVKGGKMVDLYLSRILLRLNHLTMLEKIVKIYKRYVKS